MGKLRLTEVMGLAQGHIAATWWESWDSNQPAWQQGLCLPHRAALNLCQDLVPRAGGRLIQVVPFPEGPAGGIAPPPRPLAQSQCTGAKRTAFFCSEGDRLQAGEHSSLESPGLPQEGRAGLAEGPVGARGWRWRVSGRKRSWGGSGLLEYSRMGELKVTPRTGRAG